MSRSLGSIRIDLLAGTAKFDAPIDKSNKLMGLFGATAKASGSVAQASIGLVTHSATGLFNTLFSLKGLILGAGIVFGIHEITHGLEEATDAIVGLGRKSKTLGIAAEDLSVLRFAAGEVGVDFDSLAKLAGKAERNIAEFVRTGGGKAADALQELGVNLTDANGKMLSIAELLPVIGDALQKVDGDAQRLNLSEKIFGRNNGDVFLRMLDESGDFLEKLNEQAEKAKRLGVVFNDDQVRKLTAYHEAVYGISQAWLGVRVKLMTEIAPFLQGWSEKASSFLAAVPEMARNAFNVTNEILQDKLSPENAANFAKIWDGINRLATLGVEGVFKAIVGAVIDGVVVLRNVGPPILKAAFTSLFLVPLGDVVSAGERKVGEFFKALGEGITNADSHFDEGIRADIKKAKDTLAWAYGERDKLYKEANDPSRYYSQAEHNDFSARIAVFDQGIQTAEKSLHTFEGLLGNSPSKQFGLDKLVMPLNAIGDAMIGVADSTSEGNKELQAFTITATKDDLGKAIDETFKGGSMAADSLTESIKEMGPEFVKIGQGVGGLLHVKEAMAKTSTAAKDLQVTMEHFHAPPKKVITDWDRFFGGMRAGWEEAAIKAKDVAGLGRDVFNTIDDGLSSGFAKALASGEASFRNFGKSALGVLKDVTQAVAEMVIKFQIMRAIAGIGGAIWPGAGGAGIDTSLTNLTGGGSSVGSQPAGNFGLGAGSLGIADPHARGDAFGQAGVIQNPGFFRSGDGSVNTIAEDGAEGVFPLTRTSDGGLGIRAATSGGGGSNVVLQIIDQRSSGQRPQVQQSRGPNGQQVLRVFIREEFGKMVQDGSIDRVLGPAFGVGRQGVRR